MRAYVKGLEMPKDCYDCPCHNGENGRCQITKESTEDKRPYDCPLVEEKIGKWTKIEYADEVNGYLIPNYECSQCKYWSIEDYDYCPNCGALMQKDGEA